LRWRKNELIGWSFGALVLYALGILVLGPLWPLIWLQEAKVFGDINFMINGFNMISLAGLSYWLSGLLVGDGSFLLPLGYIASLAGLLISHLYFRANEKRLLLIPYCVLLFSPQTLFYDLGIAVFFYIQALGASQEKSFHLLALLWLYCSAAILLRYDTSAPLFLLPLLMLLWGHFRRIKSLPC
jgi:hypothetical protein